MGIPLLLICYFLEFSHSYVCTLHNYNSLAIGMSCGGLLLLCWLGIRLVISEFKFVILLCALFGKKI